MSSLEKCLLKFSAHFSAGLFDFFFFMLNCVNSGGNRSLKIYMHFNVHYSFIYNSQDMETS